MIDKISEPTRNIRGSTELEIRDALSKITQMIAQLAPVTVNESYQSFEIDELAAALATAQGHYEPVLVNRINPYFQTHYADLDMIMKSVRKALANNNLSFIQQIRINSEGMTILHTRLMHGSGQWIESRCRILPSKNDDQTYGSTLTYQKRHAAMTLLGVTVADDRMDDDAEIAMIGSRKILAKGPSTKYNPKEESTETITKEQLEELEYELGDYPDLAEEIMDKLRIQSLADMPKSKFLVSIGRVREIKNARDGR
jgi:ERF superfamily